MTLSVLGDLATVGVEEAATILAAYARRGFWWWDALDELMAANATELLQGLEPVVAERAAEESLQAAGTEAMWSEGRRRIAEADRIAAQLLMPDVTEIDTRAMSTAELLSAEQGTPATMAEELAERREAQDVQLLLATAADGKATPGARWLSLRALATQGDPRLVGVIQGILRDDETPPRVRFASISAFGALPAALTLDLARGWFDDPDVRLRRAAEEVLSKHATADDVPRLVGTLPSALVEDDQYRICNVAEALERVPDRGPYPVLEACFVEMTYSFGRHRVVAALAATDPNFASDIGVECLWDCEYTTRALGCTKAELGGPTRTRLEELAEDPLENDEVVKAALRRLGWANEGPESSSM